MCFVSLVFSFLLCERSVHVPAQTEGTWLKATTRQQHSETNGKGVG